ncbi:hypothetical protein HPB49_012102 [Dermacentor silvarum]|uniref:Uncharacterized protein n=1 Tax=Dermacentor silvarum TaxID=543639 RepID=A0ACB8E0A1_DERSI|nr:hypothetical protein HPB49_012102 [Dermacentor silvarum]
MAGAVQMAVFGYRSGGAPTRLWSRLFNPAGRSGHLSHAGNLHSLGVISIKENLEICDRVTASSFCRRRLPVIMVRNQMAQRVKMATQFVEQGHVRIGPDVVTDPAFLVSRQLEDFVTWTDSSAIKKHVAEYNDMAAVPRVGPRGAREPYTLTPAESRSGLLLPAVALLSCDTERVPRFNSCDFDRPVVAVGRADVAGMRDSLPRGFALAPFCGLLYTQPVAIHTTVSWHHL